MTRLIAHIQHLTEGERALARHALGLPNHNRRSYRNRFICGDGNPDTEKWGNLVNKGMATRHPFSSNQSTRYLFALTYEGACAALDKGESLDAEDFPDTARREPINETPADVAG